MRDPELPVPGVRALEHTADVGLEIVAPDLPELFCRAAQGFLWMVLDRAPAPARLEAREVELLGDDLPSLLRNWLRTLLLWQEGEGFVAQEVTVAMVPVPTCGSPGGQAQGLRARVMGGVDPGTPVREIKGVTLHDLRVEPREGGWYGRVIFDV